MVARGSDASQAADDRDGVRSDGGGARQARPSPAFVASMLPVGWTGGRCSDDHGGVPTTDLLADLEARGLVHDSTDRDALRERLLAGPITLYCGFDPTADSLHVGSLLGLITLRRFIEAGHLPLVLVGGATGMIGDPTGRSDERTLLSPEVLAANVAGLKAQIGRILGPEGPWRMVDNADWTRDVTLLGFLGEVGRHVTVNQMLAKDSVRARLDSEQGISYTEFTYMLLQAFDFWWLHRNEGCDLQVGGSDQWGNVTGGIDLVRRREGASVHGMTWPLLLRSDGTKFGKSATGESVWLDAGRTSPYRFFQYWVNVRDDEVEGLLRRLTFLPLNEVDALVAAHAAEPSARAAQRRLARELTTIVHGAQQCAAAEDAAAALFGGPVDALDEAAFALLSGEIPTVRLPSDEVRAATVGALLQRTALVASAAEARRTGEQGGSYVNGRRRDVTDEIGDEDLLLGRYVLLRRGRRQHALVLVA